MKILHLIRRKGDAYPLQIAESQKKAGDDVKVVFLQDGVFSCTGDGSSSAARRMPTRAASPAATRWTTRE